MHRSGSPACPMELWSGHGGLPCASGDSRGRGLRYALASRVGCKSELTLKVKQDMQSGIDL